MKGFNATILIVDLVNEGFVSAPRHDVGPLSHWLTATKECWLLYFRQTCKLFLAENQAEAKTPEFAKAKVYEHIWTSSEAHIHHCQLGLWIIILNAPNWNTKHYGHDLYTEPFKSRHYWGSQSWTKTITDKNPFFFIEDCSFLMEFSPS